MVQLGKNRFRFRHGRQKFQKIFPEGLGTESIMAKNQKKTKMCRPKFQKIIKQGLDIESIKVKRLNALYWNVEYFKLRKIPQETLHLFCPFFFPSCAIPFSTVFSQNVCSIFLFTVGMEKRFSLLGKVKLCSKYRAFAILQNHKFCDINKERASQFPSHCTYYTLYDDF